MDKYDKAIEFLQELDPGSYFDECAELMEELLFLAFPERKPGRTKEELEWLEKAGKGLRYMGKVKGLL